MKIIFRNSSALFVIYSLVFHFRLLEIAWWAREISSKLAISVWPGKCLVICIDVKPGESAYVSKTSRDILIKINLTKI